MLEAEEEAAGNKEAVEDCWEEGSKLLGLLLKKRCAVGSNNEHFFFSRQRSSDLHFT